MRDYCTLSPDYINGIYIGDVCAIHDMDYEQKTMKRSLADKIFYYNLKQYVGRFWASVYYVGVRLFGWIPWHFN